MTYKIIAKINSSDNHGLSVYDWFRPLITSADDIHVLDEQFESIDDAATAARLAYRGPDIDGIECCWRIVSIG